MIVLGQQECRLSCPSALSVNTGLQILNYCISGSFLRYSGGQQAYRWWNLYNLCRLAGWFLRYEKAVQLQHGAAASDRQWFVAYLQNMHILAEWFLLLVKLCAKISICEISYIFKMKPTNYTYCSLWGGVGWSAMSRSSERWRRRESHPISWQKWAFLFQIIMLSGVGKMYRRTRLTRYAPFWTVTCPTWWNSGGRPSQSRQPRKNRRTVYHRRLWCSR